MTATDPNNTVKLQRELGLFSAVSFILSVSIGSGIFITPASVLLYSKSVGMCIVVWSVCGAIALLGALAYAELSTIVPRSGSNYAYYMETFNTYHKFWAKLPSFLFSFVAVFFTTPASIAVVLLTFSEYVSNPILNAFGIDDDNVTEEVKLGIAICGLCGITLINVLSVKLYVFIQNIFVCFKVIACLIVVGGGIYQISIGNTQNLYQGFKGTTSSPADMALAVYSGLWAFDGWAAITLITEEIKKPEVNILRSILIAVPIVTILYVFMNVSYMTVITTEEMVTVSAVAISFADITLGKFAVVIPISVALSTFSCSLGTQFMVSRLCYVAGQDGLMLKSLSYVHSKRMTPIPAVVLQGIITLLMILTRNITKLIQFISFLNFIFYSISMMSLLILKKRMKDVSRVYKVPVIVPLFLVLVFLYLTLTPIIMVPTIKYLIGIVILLTGMIFYYFCIYKEIIPDKFLSGLNRWIQILSGSIPSQKLETNETDIKEKEVAS